MVSTLSTVGTGAITSYGGYLTLSIRERICCYDLRLYVLRTLVGVVMRIEGRHHGIRIDSGAF